MALALGCLLGKVFGGFGGFGGFWRVCGLARQLWPIESHCLALALGFGGWPWRVWRTVFGGFGGFGVFAGWQTAALKAHRKPLLWPWPWGACSGSGLGPGVGAWGACWGSGLGPGVPAGQGVWRVWTVLESARRVWRVLEGVWRVWRVLERLEGFGGFGVFAGWQTAALKAHRKPLLWPWPWGA